jgi:hypothetical protein
LRAMVLTACPSYSYSDFRQEGTRVEKTLK